MTPDQVARCIKIDKLRATGAGAKWLRQQSKSANRFDTLPFLHPRFAISRRGRFLPVEEDQGRLLVDASEAYFFATLAAASAAAAAFWQKMAASPTRFIELVGVDQSLQIEQTAGGMDIWIRDRAATPHHTLGPRHSIIYASVGLSEYLTFVPTMYFSWGRA